MKKASYIWWVHTQIHKNCQIFVVPDDSKNLSVFICGVSGRERESRRQSWATRQQKTVYDPHSNLRHRRPMALHVRCCGGDNANWPFRSRAIFVCLPQYYPHINDYINCELHLFGEWNWRLSDSISVRSQIAQGWRHTHTLHAGRIRLPARPSAENATLRQKTK